MPCRQRDLEQVCIAGELNRSGRCRSIDGYDTLGGSVTCIIIYGNNYRLCGTSAVAVARGD